MCFDSTHVPGIVNRLYSDFVTICVLCERFHIMERWRMHAVYLCPQPTYIYDLGIGQTVPHLPDDCSICTRVFRRVLCGGGVRDLSLIHI